MFENLKFNLTFTCSKFLAYMVVLIGAGYGFLLKRYDDGIWLIAMGVGLMGGKSFISTRERMYGQKKGGAIDD
jgi:hypothetical protein